MKRDSSHSVLRSTAGAVLLLLSLAMGCGKPHDWWEFHVVQGAHVSLPPVTGQERLYLNRQGPAQPLQVGMGGNQTLLIGSRVHDDPQATDDEWSNTFVIVLDGPPKPGKYVVGLNNGRFIMTSAWVPARQPYIGLDGWVRITSVDRNGDVVAWCAVHNHSSLHGDKAYWMEGPLRFKPTIEGNLRGVVIRGMAPPKDEPAQK